MRLGRRTGPALLCLGLMHGAEARAQNWWDALPRAVYKTLPRLEVQSPWFEVYRVAPGVIALYEPGHYEEALSYLIGGDERALLFDTGMGIGDIKAVVDQLTQKPLLVLNSHTHYDHIGGNRQFTQIAAHEGDFTRERLARGVPDLSRSITAESVWKPLPPGFDPRTYRIPPVEPTRVVRDGEILDLGGRKLEVLFTPGHTADSLCLLDRANRILFTGDTFYPAPLYAHTADANFEDYCRSTERLGKLADQVDIICPGHNEARVSGEVLPRLASAFESIRSGRATPKSEERGVRRFDFQGFSVLVGEQK